MNYLQYKKIKKTVENIYRNSGKGGIHGYSHTIRVEKNIIKLKKVIERFYDIDENLLKVCALLHDITYCYEEHNMYNYFLEGKLAKIYVKKVLKNLDIDEQESETILQAIYRHNLSFPFHRLNRKSDIYTMLLQDADTLDMFSNQRLLEKFTEFHLRKIFRPVFDLFQELTQYYFSNINYRAFSYMYTSQEPSYVIYNQEQKDTIVCLHGYADKGTLFNHLQNLLPQHRIIAIYFPTHNFKRIFSLDEIVCYINNLISELNIDKFTLTGFSLGGLVSVEYAYRYRHKVKKLVLLNSLPYLLFQKSRRYIYKFTARFLISKPGLILVSKITTNKKYRKHMPFADIPDHVLNELQKKILFNIRDTF